MDDATTRTQLPSRMTPNSDFEEEPPSPRLSSGRSQSKDFSKRSTATKAILVIIAVMRIEVSISLVALKLDAHLALETYVFVQKAGGRQH